MVGEKYFAGILKESLGLAPEDIEGLKLVIQQLKEQGPKLMDDLPQYIQRIEGVERSVKATEVRVQALIFFFKAMDPVHWEEAEKQALAYNKKKEEKAACVLPRDGMK